MSSNTNIRMANYLKQQGKTVEHQAENGKIYSNSTGSVPSTASSTISNSASSYSSVSGPQPTGTAIPVAQPIVGSYDATGSMVSYQQSQQYSSAPTTRSLNTNKVTENNTKRNVKFTETENKQAGLSVSAATEIADLYERYQRELQQLQQVTANSRIQTIESTKKALYNQREAFKKRLIEAAQKLLQTVETIKRMETELTMNMKGVPGRVPFAIGKIF